MDSILVPKKSGIGLFLCLLGIFVTASTLVVAITVNSLLYTENHSTQEEIQPEPEPEPPVPTEPELPHQIDFQPLVDEWVGSIGGTKSVMIYDLDRDELVGIHNPDEAYNTASLYKLFVVYEGYRKLQSGEWLQDDVAGSTGYTIAQCLDLAIRESHSACAETLWGMIGRAELEEIITGDFSIVDSDINHLISNPRDILAIMEIFYHHVDITDESLLAAMKDSFLNQPPTIYDWRQGLPSGFSERAKVYNKVGWDYNPNGGYWNIYHDAAIIEFPDQDRHFIIVVMSNLVPFQKIRAFGSSFEEYFYNALGI